MTAVTFPLRSPRLPFAICGRRWQNDLHEIKYSVCEDSELANLPVGTYDCLRYAWTQKSLVVTDQ